MFNYCDPNCLVPSPLQDIGPIGNIEFNNYAFFTLKQIPYW